MTWVPELSVRDADPWAHRKGEPRPLALLWAIYLMASAFLTIFAVRSLSVPTTIQFVSACRGMIVMTLLGTFVLWPLTRLSQQFPPRPGRAIVADLLVLLVPIQAALWPMMLLTRWPIEVMTALVTLVISWTLLAGAIILRAHTAPHDSAASRARAASIPLACILIPPAATLLAPTIGFQLPAWVAMLSPITAAYHLVDAPSGLAPQMALIEWLGVAAPALLAALFMLIPRSTAYTNPHPPEPARPDGQERS